MVAAHSPSEKVESTINQQKYCGPFSHFRPQPLHIWLKTSLSIFGCTYTFLSLKILIRIGDKGQAWRSPSVLGRVRAQPLPQLSATASGRDAWRPIRYRSTHSWWNFLSCKILLHSILNHCAELLHLISLPAHAESREHAHSSQSRLEAQDLALHKTDRFITLLWQAPHEPSSILARVKSWSAVPRPRQNPHYSPWIWASTVGLSFLSGINFPGSNLSWAVWFPDNWRQSCSHELEPALSELKIKPFAVEKKCDFSSKQTCSLHLVTLSTLITRLHQSSLLLCFFTKH